MQVSVKDVDDTTRLFTVVGDLDEVAMAEVNGQIIDWLNAFSNRSSPLADIIVDVRGLTSQPSPKASIKLGTEVTGHKKLWYVAVVGVPGPVRAVFNLLHLFGGRRFQFFETVEEAESFLVEKKARRPSQPLP